MYEDVIAFLIENEDPNEASNQREKLGEQALTDIRTRHPGTPEEFLQFLKEVGWGSFLEDSYMVYNGFFEPSFVFGEENAPLDEEICLFGDDFCGNSAGFEKSTWEVVEITPSRRIKKTGLTFGQFIRKRMGM